MTWNNSKNKQKKNSFWDFSLQDALLIYNEQNVHVAEIKYDITV